MTDSNRQAALVQLSGHSRDDGRVLVRTQHFTVERLADGGMRKFDFGSATETILLLPGVGATLKGDHDGVVPGHAIAILPAGTYELQLTAPGEVYVLATDRLDPLLEAVNADSYAEPDRRVRPVGTPFARRNGRSGIRVYRVEDIAIPPDNGRLRFLQSETMSLNWVEYSGTRDRDALSPHSHEDFEQATLAIQGDFIHHLRTPWGRNANLWREDLHLPAGAGSMVVIPPKIIHTTEGVGDGLHILIDIFAPPRRDFIARNWVFNAGEYAEPALVHA